MVGPEGAFGTNGVCRSRKSAVERSTLTDSPQLSPGEDPAPILYVSDVDRTLLGSDGTLSRYSRDTLNRLLEKHSLTLQISSTPRSRGASTSSVRSTIRLGR